MICAQIKDYKTYLTSSVWDEPFEFLSALEDNAQEGRYTFAHNVRAEVVSARSRQADTALFEAHRNHIDIHVLLAGAEDIWVHPGADLKVIKSYDPAKDIEFLSLPSVPQTRICQRPGSFLVCFPEDAHLPLVTPAQGRDASVKKVIIKVPV